MALKTQSLSPQRFTDASGQYTPIDVGNAGDNTIVAADPNAKIKVLSYVVVVDSATAIRWKSGAKTSLSGAMSLIANGGIAISAPAGMHLLETNLGDALVLNLSIGVGARGHLLYVKSGT